MDPDNARKCALGCCGLMVLVLGAIFTMPLWKRDGAFEAGLRRERERRDQEAMAQPPAPPPAEAPPRSPRAELEGLWHGQRHPEAWTLARRLLQEGDPDAQAAARQWLPGLATSLFETACQAGDEARMQAVRAETKSLLDKASGADAAELRRRLRDHLANMARRLREAKLEQARAAFRSGDASAIEAVIAAAWDDPEAALPEQECREFLAGRWRERHDAGDEPGAEAALRRAAEFAAGDVQDIQYWGYRNGALEAALGVAYPYDELLARGRAALAAGDPALAVTWLSAAIRMSSASDSRLSVPVPDWVARQRSFSQALIALARAAELDRLRWLPPDRGFENKVEILLQLAASQGREAGQRDSADLPPARKFAEALQAGDELFSLYRGKLDRLREAESPDRVIGFCDQVMHAAVGDWLRVRGECLGPEPVLAGLPAAMRTALAEGASGLDEQLLRLLEQVRTRQCSPDFPGKEAFVDARRRACFEAGLDLVGRGQWPEGFAYFRHVLRQDPGSTEAAEITRLLSAQVDRARTARDFGRLHNLASFLIGEIHGQPFPADIARQLADCLTAAADHYRENSPMKRVFMLSLLADVLGDTPAGAAAHAEAMALGFAAVKSLALRSPEKPALTLPSLVPGCSVDAMENATPYHLMAFYEGPERFFVRLTPYTKGSLAIRDGEYELAVVVTGDEVVPYRAQYRYQAEVFAHSYYISEGGGANPPGAPGLTSGSFSLLRVPPGHDDLMVEPQSGVVFRRP